MRPINELRAVDEALKQYPLLPDDVGMDGTAGKVLWLVHRLIATEKTLKNMRDENSKEVSWIK